MNDINQAMMKLKEDDLLFEMANIQPRTTGLSNQLYSSFDGKTLYKHGHRVKVRTPKFPKGFPVIINRKTDKVYPLNDEGQFDILKPDEKKPISEAVPYIEKYKKEFLAHWDALIGDEQLKKVLRGEYTLEQAIQDAKENGPE